MGKIVQNTKSKYSFLLTLSGKGSKLEKTFDADISITENCHYEIAFTSLKTYYSVPKSILDNLIEKYNNTVNRAIGMTPTKARKPSNHGAVFRYLYFKKMAELGEKKQNFKSVTKYVWEQKKISLKNRMLLIDWMKYIQLNRSSQ